MPSSTELQARWQTMHRRHHISHSQRFVWIALALAYFISTSCTLAGPTNTKEEAPVKEKLYGKLVVAMPFISG